MPDEGQPTDFTMQEFAQAMLDRAEIVDAQLRAYDRENMVLRQTIFEELKPGDCSCSHNDEVVHAVHNGERVPDVH